VLLLHRHMRHLDVVAGIAAALSAGALTADAVALEARKIADATPVAVAAEPDSVQVPGAAAEPVSSLTRHRLARLPGDTRPLPRVDLYDQLLQRRTPEGGPG